MDDMRSHPSWVCGLKLTCTDDVTLVLLSHPSWVCGLKQNDLQSANVAKTVTPFVGVWIETLGEKEKLPYIWSHPSWVCGLKLKSRCHQSVEGFVTPFVGVWIETL